MYRYFTLFCLFTLAACKLSGQSLSVQHINSGFEAVELINPDFLPGDQKLLSESIRKGAAWESYGNFRFRTLFSTRHHWLRFSLHNEDSISHKLVLELSNSSVPEVELAVFSATEKGKDSLFFNTTGADYPFRSRAERYRFIHFPITLAGNSTSEVYLKIKGNGINHVVPIHIRAEQNMINVRRSRLTFMTAFFSIMFTIMIFGSLILILIKTPFRWTYLVFIIAGTFNVATFLGFSFQYLWPGFPPIQMAAPHILSNITFFSGLALLQALFRTRQKYPIINRALDILLVAFGLMLLTSFLIPTFSPSVLRFWFRAEQILFISGGLIVLISPIAFFVRNQDLEGVAFFMVIGLFMFSTIIRSAEALDLWRLSWTISVLLWTGLILMNLTLALFILRRIRITIDDGFRITGEMTRRKRMNMMVLLRREAGVRAEIGDEIEERVGPLLKSVEQQLSKIPNDSEIENLMAQVKGAQVEIRGISENRIPGNLADMDLIPALDEIMLPLEENGIKIVRNYPRSRRIKNIDILYKQAIFRIAQGLLNNIYKHANAKNVEIALSVEEEVLNLRIKDDGIGYKPDPDSGGKGLQIIRRRVESLGGTFEAQSASGGGTNANVSLKLRF